MSGIGMIMSVLNWKCLDVHYKVCIDIVKVAIVGSKFYGFWYLGWPHCQPSLHF